MLYDQLWPFQKTAFNFARNAPNFHTALFCEQGTGKTWIAIALIEKWWLCDTLSPFSALIVAPLSTIQIDDGWRDVISKTNLKFYQDLDSFKKAKHAKILLLNWETIYSRKTLASKRMAKFIVNNLWSFVCFDESQKMKARNSKQSRLAGRIKSADYRLILSGTPFDDPLDDPQEIWAQWRFLNSDLFGSRWADFDADYLKKTGWMGKKRKFRQKKKDIVLSMIKPNSLRVKKEVLGLKPVEYVWCPVSMFGNQRRLYDSMDTDQVVVVDGKEIVADLTITKDIKLQQISGGFIKDEDGHNHLIGRAKLRKLKSIIKKTGYPVVIFTRYICEVDMIAQELSSGNVSIATIIGKTRRTRGETIKCFQEGKIDILVAQVKTGGVGINLQECCYNGIFYSTTFSYIDFEQAVSRIHRAGQRKKVKIFLLFCQNSVDKRIYKVIISKRNVNEQILNLFKIQPKT